MAAFQHKPQQNVMQHPQMPTANGYQIAGAGLREAAKMATDYSQIFSDMVEDRKNAMWEDRKREWETQDRQRQEAENQKKLDEENDLKERKRGFAEYLTTIPEGDPDSYNKILQGKIKYGFAEPDDIIKQKTAPVDRQREWDDWEKKENLKHKHLSERNKSSKASAKKEDRYKGYSPVQAQLLQKIDSGTASKDDIKAKIHAQLDHLSLEINRLKGDASMDEAAKMELKERVKEKIESRNFLEVVEGWEGGSSGQGGASMSGGGPGESVSIIQQNVDKLNPMQKAVFAEIQKNPSNPKAQAALRKLEMELKLVQSPR